MTARIKNIEIDEPATLVKNSAAIIFCKNIQRLRFYVTSTVNVIRCKMFLQQGSNFIHTSFIDSNSRNPYKPSSANVSILESFTFCHKVCNKIPFIRTCILRQRSYIFKCKLKLLYIRKSVKVNKKIDMRYFDYPLSRGVRNFEKSRLEINHSRGLVRGEHLFLFENFDRLSLGRYIPCIQNSTVSERLLKM